MATINRDGIEFTVYATEDDADQYALGSMDSAAWDAATSDEKERALISSTRILDRQQWVAGYETFELREQNENIVNASIEMAFYLTAGSDLETNGNQSIKTVSSLSAGSVSISYQVSSGGTIGGSSTGSSRWPLPIEEKLYGLLAGSSTATGIMGVGSGLIAGTDGCSVNNNDFDLLRGY